MEKADWENRNPYPKRYKKLGLSPREAEIIRGLALGKTRAQLAVQLGLSPHTIKSHLVRAYRFLGAANAIDAYRKMQVSQPDEMAETAVLEFLQADKLPDGLQVHIQDGRLQFTFEMGRSPRQ